MEAITLRNDLRETLEENARSESKSVDEIINEAVEYYLREQHVEALELEITAYRRMHARLFKEYAGQWVAIHDQKLFDSDHDRAALYQRVRSNLGQRVVLIRQVLPQPDADIWMRTPSYGKKS